MVAWSEEQVPGAPADLAVAVATAQEKACREAFERSWMAHGPAQLTAAGRAQWRQTVQAVIDHQEEWLEDAQGCLARAGGDRTYSVWLSLVDHHLACSAHSEAELGSSQLRTAYTSGWSPHETAAAAVRVAERPELADAYGLDRKPPAARVEL